jgi:hypothetical protein
MEAREMKCELQQHLEEFIDLVRRGGFSAYGDEERTYLIEDRAHRFASLFEQDLETLEVLMQAVHPTIEVLLRPRIEADGDTWYVPSRSVPGRVWEVSLGSCTCTAGRYGRRCRHRAALHELRQALVVAENGRLTANLGCINLIADGHVAHVVSWSGEILNTVELPGWLVMHWRDKALPASYEPFEEVGS